MRAQDRDDTPLFSWYLHWSLPEPRWEWLKQAGEWKSLVRAYLATVSFVDSQVGRVLDALQEQGYQENTVVVLWSDHGWHLGEKAITGKNSLWDRSTRVPLIFAGPGVARSSRCQKPAELLDLYPTLADLAGLPQPEGVEGHSLILQLKDANAPRIWPAITTHNHDNHGVRSERWRYIRYADGSEELYDMQQDPDCINNLAGKPELKAIKTALWEQLRKELTEQEDPRMIGNGDIFDFYPNRHISRQQDLYKQPDYDPVGDFETRYGSSTERK